MKRDKALKYLKLAFYQAELFSKDPNTKVAAILLSHDTHIVLSTGYNGMPRGMDDNNPARWQRPSKYFYVSHAEMNSLCSAARHGTAVENAIAVVTMFPCCDCAKALIQAGIKTIITIKPDLETPKWGEQFKISMEMFHEVGIQVFLFTTSDTSSCGHTTCANDLNTNNGGD
jgi:dCMP deaminase